MTARETLSAVGKGLFAAVLTIGTLALVAQFVWAAVVYPAGAAVVCALFASLVAFNWWIRPSEDVLSATDLTD